jgi:hypothetical protein
MSGPELAPGGFPDWRAIGRRIPKGVAYHRNLATSGKINSDSARNINLQSP